MSTIKLVSIIEATSVTGPAKNLLNFSRLLHSPEFQIGGRPPAEFSIVTFERQRSGQGRSPRGDSAFVLAARAQGIEVDVISERFRFDPQVINHLREIVAKRAPHIVQTHMVKSHFLTKLSGMGRKYPWIAYHHGYTTTDLKMRGYNQLNRWSLPSAARVITVCGPFADDLSRAGVRRDRIVVRHNSVAAPAPVSPQAKNQLRARLGITDGERVILTVGRLSHEKGHLDLVRALAVLRAINPAVNFKLVIVGEGPEQTRVQTAARQAGVAENIIFAGHTTDVQPYYSIADVLAMPSHSEGSPNVLLEAMAASLPAVATAVGGVPEISDQGKHAILVEPYNARSLAEALNRLLTDSGLARKLGDAAAVHVSQHFSPSAYARSLLCLYQSLARETGQL